VNQRSDARRNRARIVAAAAEVFREGGGLVPLDLITRRAGVGRGTLYRHFPDRGALIAAVLELRVDALERYAAGYRGDDLLEHLLVEIFALQVDASGLLAVARSFVAEPARLDDVVRRTQALMSGALDAAHRGGVVRADVTLTDVFLAFAMVDGAVSARANMPGTAASPAQVDRALALVLRALRSESRVSLPMPRPELHLPSPTDVDPAT
jgi:AcrR family transcriptional regulator